MADLSQTKVHLGRALEDLEAAAAEEGNLFVQECPRVHQALEEVRAAKKAIAEYELDVELEERRS